MFLNLHHFSHNFLLMKKQGFQQEFVFVIVWSFKPVRISCWHSKSGEMRVVAIPLGGLGDGDLFSLKSSPLGFWQWRSSNIFHPSLCFLCFSASGIENKPKRKARQSTFSLWPRRRSLGGTKAGRRVCVGEDVGH